MEKKIDAEKAIQTLVELWAFQNGITVTRRGSNEEIFNSANSAGNA